MMGVLLDLVSTMNDAFTGTILQKLAAWGEDIRFHEIPGGNELLPRAFLTVNLLAVSLLIGVKILNLLAVSLCIRHNRRQS
ncbi:hypothetical protein GC102_38195 [Paenibacillus sp. LMG 31460]|uniref:Uncharacterized protein n=1 Tax=Paenibacillus germinis TaxID=2654979 RepID=A0ABX1ZDX6_9BACL|nr:hypothetical protein [Paenibacillus germinis]NOU91517.1 hypothetical protein [Paenibacillus germinis]